MIKECKQCNAGYIVDKDYLDFLDRISPSFKWNKYLIPVSEHCSDCRQQRKIAFRNERNLYRRKCDLTWEDVISAYSPDKNFLIYNTSDWWSDKWNPMDYWMDFDFNKSFFDQFNDLILRVPKLASFIHSTMENCGFCNYGQASKDCYMCFSAVWSENCINSQTPCSCIQDVDWVFNIQNQYCYNCVQCNSWYNLLHSSYSQNCKDSYFLLDCVSCDHCFWCVNLQHKKYCFLNEQLSEQDYKNKINKIIWSFRELSKFKSEFDNFILKNPRKNVRNTNAENCSWDFIQNSKDCKNCFSVVWAEKFVDCDVSWYAFDIRSSYFTWDKASLIYESSWYWRSNKCAFWFYGFDNHDCYYSFYLNNCSNCFACEWLKHKSYCIFNKQYTKQEYEALVPKIIEHMQKTKEWWEFFPIELSPFAYNETVAQEYFPLIKEEIENTYSKWLFNNNTSAWTWLIAPMRKDQDHNQSIQKGWKWKDQNDQIPDVTKVIPATRLPDTIKDIPDDILNWAIKCEKTNRPFKIIAQELEFYRKHNIPIPHLHPDQRHKERIMLRNPRRLFNRKCMKCDKQIQTSYAPEKPEIVYCEECYMGEIY